MPTFLPYIELNRLRLLLVIFLGSLPFLSFPQNTDSLLRIWKSDKSGMEEKFQALQALSDAYAYSYKADSALIYAKLLLDLAGKFNSPARESEVLLYMSSIYYEDSRYDEALLCLEKSLALSLEVNNPNKLPDIYRMFGVVLEALGDPAKSLEYFKLSYQTSLENKDSISLSKALNSLAISNQYYLGNYQQAISYYLEAIAVNKALNRIAGLGNNYYNLSGSYYSLGNTVQAIRYQLDALKQFERLKDTVGIQDSYNSIGNTYSLQKDYDKALEYFRMSLDLSQRTKDRVSEALVRINIGNVKLDMDELAEAGVQLEEGVRILEQIGNRNYLDHGYLNLGKYNLRTANHAQARTYLENAVLLAKEEHDDGALASSLSGLGAVAYEEGKYHESLKFLKEAIPFARKLQNKEALSDIYRHLYRAYSALGQTQNELSSYRNYILYRDSLIDMQSIRETTRQEMEFNFARKQLADSLKFAHQQTLKELQIRRGRSQRNFAFIGMLILIISTGLVYRQYRFTKKARKRSDELLLNILPAEIALELKEKGKAEARHYDMVSILFTDFKGFTRNAEQLTASELIGEINYCFEAFDYIMEKYRIEKIKTIGDAYMAAGGLPVPFPESCKNTILAALEMQSFISRRKEQNDGNNRMSFEMRVGIHTGPVVAGIAGVKKFQYDIWGDTVNTASRMESQGEVGKVNISQTTYEIARHTGIFNFEDRGEIQVKGKGELAMYFVTHKPPDGG